MGHVRLLFGEGLGQRKKDANALPDDEKAEVAGKSGFKCYPG
jgi:hypothetical protein